MVRYFILFFLVRLTFSSEPDRKQCVLEGTFPCKDLKKSETKPKSVHKLKPGDIDVVAAIGDSLSSGMGAMSPNIGKALIEYRGVSFSIGGRGNWQTYTTLPNILKEFNPNLIGMSYGTTVFGTKQVDNYNIAIGGSYAIDTNKQAKYIIKKMKNDTKINFNTDWKMVTVLTGHLDLCMDACKENHIQDPEIAVGNLKPMLDTLYHGLPRTFVNLMPIQDISQLWDMQLSKLCLFQRRFMCPCFFAPLPNLKRIHKQKAKAWIKKFNQKLVDLVETGRYDQKEDFTVVIQPILLKSWGTNTHPSGHLGPDCFHWSQRTHAEISIGLWNNLIQPVGQKSESSGLRTRSSKQPFLCPSEEIPYLATSANSINATNHGIWIYYPKGCKL